MKLLALVVTVSIGSVFGIQYEKPPTPDKAPPDVQVQPPVPGGEDCLPISLFGLAGDIPEDCITVDETGCETVKPECMEEDGAEETTEAPEEESVTESPAEEAPTTEEHVVNGEETPEGTAEVEKEEPADTSPPTDDCVPISLFGLVGDIPEDCIEVGKDGCEIIKEECLKEDDDEGMPLVPTKPIAEETMPVKPQLEETETSSQEMVPPASGEDAEEYCCWWAQKGECEVNPYWMRPMCQKSCGTPDCSVANAEECAVAINVEGCKWKDDAAGAPGGGAPGYGTGMGKPTGCADEDKLCNFWKFSGECENNPAYMDVACAKACGKC